MWDTLSPGEGVPEAPHRLVQGEVRGQVRGSFHRHWPPADLGNVGAAPCVVGQRQ